MEKKKCICCGDEKELDDYYAHQMMADGHLNKCKTCCKDHANKRRHDKIEEVREYDRKRGSLPHRVKARKDYMDKLKRDGKFSEMKQGYIKKYRDNNKDKARATRMVSYHVGVGHLKKKPCEVCGDVNSQAHHEDYSLPLEVIWLCDKHHKELHVKNGSFRKK